MLLPFNVPLVLRIKRAAKLHLTLLYGGKYCKSKDICKREGLEIQMFLMKMKDWKFWMPFVEPNTNYDYKILNINYLIKESQVLQHFFALWFYIENNTKAFQSLNSKQKWCEGILWFESQTMIKTEFQIVKKSLGSKNFENRKVFLANKFQNPRLTFFFC